MPTVDAHPVDLPDRGVRLYHRDWGGEGQPLALLHGLTSNSRIWDFTAPLLAEQFRVLALDQRGHGLSDKPEGTEAYNFDEVAADLASWIGVLGLDRPLLAGHSWGAGVVLKFAADYPDMTRGIVLVDGGFMEIWRHITWEQAEKLMMPPAIDGMPVTEFVQMMRRWPQLAGMWSEDLEEIVLSNFEIMEDGAIQRRLSVDKHMAIARALYDLRAADLFERLRCPALLIPAIGGSKLELDRLWQSWREDGLAMARRANPGVQILYMQDTIHDVPLQRPRELADAITSFATSLR